jgi:hypothetical protein
MKFAISTLLSAMLAFALALYLPWWSIAVAAFIVAIAIPQRPLAAFLAGFVGLFLLWFILTLAINSYNANILAPKVSAIMGLGASSFMLVLITCILGALVGGLSALTGSLFLNVIFKDR